MAYYVSHSKLNWRAEKYATLFVLPFPITLITTGYNYC